MKTDSASSRLRRPVDLDDLLNYKLSRLLAVSGSPVVRLCEGRYGISRREWRLVALVAAHGPLSPSLLAEHAHLDRARTSRAITSLVAKKLLARSIEWGDRRRASVALSASGQRLYDQLFPEVALLNREVVSVLDDALLQLFADALDRLTRRAEEVNRVRVGTAGANRSRRARRDE